MKVSRKLRIAVTCLAIAGFTVACTKDNKKNTPIVSADISSEKDAPQKDESQTDKQETAAEKALREAADRIAARQIMSTQLQEMADSGLECDSSDQIIEDNALIKSTTSHMLNGISGVQIGSVRVINTTNELEDFNCQVDVIAKVSKSVKVAYVDSQMNDFSTTEENEASFGKAATYLATVRPAWELAKAKVFVRDRAASLEATYAETDVQLESAAKSLRRLKRRASDIFNGMAVENSNSAREDVAFARTYRANLVKMHIEPGQALLEDLESAGRKNEMNANAELKMATDLANSLEAQIEFADRAMKLVKVPANPSSDHHPEAQLKQAAPSVPSNSSAGYQRPAPKAAAQEIEIDNSAPEEATH